MTGYLIKSLTHQRSEVYHNKNYTVKHNDGTKHFEVFREPMCTAEKATVWALIVQVRIGDRMNVEHSGVIALKDLVDAIGRNPLFSGH